LSFGSRGGVAVAEMLHLQSRLRLLSGSVAPAFVSHRLAGASLRRPSRSCTKAFVAGCEGLRVDGWSCGGRRTGAVRAAWWCGGCFVRSGPNAAASAPEDGVKCARR
jgi:hypothetical protein